MKIAIIGSHNWPINNPATPPYTGDFFMALLCKGLDELGHTVSFVAPKGSYKPPNGFLIDMPAAHGKYPPSSFDCECAAYYENEQKLKDQDVVCDFSHTKFIAESLFKAGKKEVCSSILSGWNYPMTPRNIIVCSEAQRIRGLTGDTDYANTLIPEMGGPRQRVITSAKVVHLGIDTDFYVSTKQDENFHTPIGTEKNDYFLWMGRWHPVRGYKEAIEIAKATGINLIMAGEDPQEALMPHQRECCLEAQELAANCHNIVFRWLPANSVANAYKRKLLSNAKAFLLTTQYQEPFGLSQVEAMSCGCPIISTSYGSMPEVIGDCGFCVANDVKSFSNMIERVHLIDPEQCKKRAVKLFDYRVMAKNYEKLFSELVNGGSW